MQIHLQYGRDGLTAELPTANATIIRPRFVEGLADEQAAFHDAVRSPRDAPPLAEAVHAHERVAIVIADGTRPLPSARLLPWILAELAHVPEENVSIIVGTGTHRPNTAEELEGIVGAEVCRRLRVINHNAYDEESMAVVRAGQDGRGPLMMNRAYAEADRRILVGFIEPHFMAGFSGGYKAAFPGVADLASIMHYHRAEIIGHPQSKWGVLEGNPTQEQIRANASALPVDFLVNVTLNHKRQITRFFCGDVISRARGGLPLREGDGHGPGRPALPTGDHHQQRLSAGPEPLPVGEGDVRRRGDYRGQRRDDRGRPLQRRLPGARQFHETALRAQFAAGDAGDDLPSRLSYAGSVAGAEVRRGGAAGAGGDIQ